MLIVVQLNIIVTTQIWKRQCDKACWNQCWALRVEARDSVPDLVKVMHMSSQSSTKSWDTHTDPCVPNPKQQSQKQLNFLVEISLLPNPCRLWKEGICQSRLAGSNETNALCGYSLRQAVQGLGGCSVASNDNTCFQHFGWSALLQQHPHPQQFWWLLHMNRMGFLSCLEPKYALWTSEFCEM